MNPLRLRRILVLVNGALILGLLATGVWWFTSIRPNAADAAQPPKWTAPSFEQYQLEARRARGPTVWPVDETAIKQIIPSDAAMSPGEVGGPSAWPYLGPIPGHDSKRGSSGMGR